MSHNSSIPSLAAVAIVGTTMLAIGSGQLAAQHDPQAPLQPHAMAAHDHAASPAGEAYQAALERMHGAMAIDPTGDPDVDFARGMIPHHQGAIDMAQALLAYGQDAALKALAEGIIAAQEQEIAFLRAWLAQRDKAG